MPPKKTPKQFAAKVANPALFGGLAFVAAKSGSYAKAYPAPWDDWLAGGCAVVTILALVLGLYHLYRATLSKQ